MCSMFSFDKKSNIISAPFVKCFLSSEIDRLIGSLFWLVCFPGVVFLLPIILDSFSHLSLSGYRFIK